MTEDQGKAVIATLAGVLILAALTFLVFQIGRMDVRDSCIEYGWVRVAGAKIVCSVENEPTP